MTGGRAVLAAIRDLDRQLPPLHPVWRAYRLLLHAELARAERNTDPGQWSEVIDAFEPLHRPYELAMAQHRRAAALLTTRTGRAEAGELIAEAHGTALRLGARLLAEDVELLAGHAGLGLPATSTATEHSETAGEGDGMPMTTCVRWA